MRGPRSQKATLTAFLPLGQRVIDVSAILGASNALRELPNGRDPTSMPSGTLIFRVAERPPERTTLRELKNSGAAQARPHLNF